MAHPTACRSCEENTYYWNGLCYDCVPTCEHNRKVYNDCAYCEVG